MAKKDINEIIMKRINILFICKHNVFRSRFAEAIFNKLAKNPSYKTKSAGIVSMSNLVPLMERDADMIYEQRKIAKNLGIALVGAPKKINKKLFNWADIIVVTADDVPLGVFKKNKKLVVWKIPDIKRKSMNKMKKDIEETIKNIKFRVKKLIRVLK